MKSKLYQSFSPGLKNHFGISFPAKKIRVIIRLIAIGVFFVLPTGRSAAQAILCPGGIILPNGGSCPSVQIITSLPVNPVCPGTSYTATYHTEFPMALDNHFSVQLSDAAGLFTNPVVIGSIASSSPSGTITVIFPATSSGSGFRIRTVADHPVLTGTPSGPITINPLQKFYQDNDADGFGNPTQFVVNCSAPIGYVSDNTDCDDANGNLHANTYYRDADGDGFGDPANSVTACTRPAGYANNNTDCDDNNAGIFLATYYRDADGDGFGNINSLLKSCTKPAGYVSDFTDCDDSNPGIHGPVTYYRDADGDGFGDLNNLIHTCSTIIPFGYTLNSQDCDDGLLTYADNDGDGFGSTTFAPCGVLSKNDCNDNDNNIHPLTYYRDRDLDGFGDINSTVVSCATMPPGGYVVNALDCNDNLILYNDADGDGYGSGSPAQCGVPDNTDCDDNDANGHSAHTYYRDADGDSFGNSSIRVFTCSSTAPPGYTSDHSDCNDAKILYADNDGDGFGGGTARACGVDNSTDCNDNDAGIHKPKQYYVDADHDGFGSAITAMVCTSVAPTGYASNNTDCNDKDKNVHAPQIYYVDADRDGFGSTKTASLCLAVAPTGYSVNNTDCNDKDKNVHAPQIYYVDADRDGFGSTKTVLLCVAVAPSGYSVNNTDCNDNDKNIHAPKLYYVDEDRDGYGSTTTALLCKATAPAGYSINNFDCNDKKANVHPNAPEICGNGIDDNCNGLVDESATGLTTTNIGAVYATVNWTPQHSTLLWQLDFRKSNSTSWMSIPILGNFRNWILLPLLPNQSYEWRLRALCGLSWGTYSNTVTFKTTTPGKLQANSNEVSLSAGKQDDMAILDASSLSLAASPNPSTHYFNLSIRSTRANGNISLRVVDMAGRVIEQRASVNGDALIRLGDNYQPGLFLVEVIQGDERRTIKLLKQ